MDRDQKPGARHLLFSPSVERDGWDPTALSGTDPKISASAQDEHLFADPPTRGGICGENTQGDKITSEKQGRQI